MDKATLSAELETAKAQGIALVDQNKGKRLSAEVKAQLDKIIGQTEELKVQIDEIDYLDDKGKHFDNLTTWFEKDPQRKVPRGTRVGNNESETQKALSAMGWEVKGGIVQAPTSFGTMVKLWPSEVLFGDLAEIREDDPIAAQDFKATRRTFQPDYRGAYLKYHRLAVKFGDQSKAWTALEGVEQKALTEGTDTAGGILVPPDVQAEILARLPMIAKMRNLCRVVPTSRDLLVFPMIAPASTTAGGLASGADSIFTSAFVGSWASETPAFVDTDPKINAFSIPVRKIRAATRVSNDLLSDSVFPFLSFLASDGAENIALVEDLGFINGNGTGLQPMGILNVPNIPTVDITGTTAHTISNTSANTGSWPKILKIQASLPEQYARGASWLWHRLVGLNIRTLTDANLRPLWAPGYLSPTGSAGEPMEQFQAHPVDRSDFVPQDGTVAATVMIYADFNRYIIAQRAGITTTVLRERFADTDQTGIILWERVGGNFWNADAARFGTVS